MADPFENVQALIETLKGELQSLRIVELKRVLEQLSLSRSGNKAELVDRVVHNVQILHQCVCLHCVVWLGLEWSVSVLHWLCC